VSLVDDAMGAGEHPCDMPYQSPKSVRIKASPQQSTPGLTPELCQLLNADVDVHRAASLDNVCESSDLDTGDQLQVLPDSHSPLKTKVSDKFKALDLYLQSVPKSVGLSCFDLFA